MYVYAYHKFSGDVITFQDLKKTANHWIISFWDVLLYCIVLYCTHLCNVLSVFLSVLVWI